jgi:hypothetical protein
VLQKNNGRFEFEAAVQSLTIIPSRKVDYRSSKSVHFFFTASAAAFATCS